MTIIPLPNHQADMHSSNNSRFPRVRNYGSEIQESIRVLRESYSHILFGHSHTEDNENEQNNQNNEDTVSPE